MRGDGGGEIARGICEKICKFMCDLVEIGADCQVATVRWKTDL